MNLEDFKKQIERIEQDTIVPIFKKCAKKNSRKRTLKLKKEFIKK